MILEDSYAEFYEYLDRVYSQVFHIFGEDVLVKGSDFLCNSQYKLDGGSEYLVDLLFAHWMQRRG